MDMSIFNNLFSMMQNNNQQPQQSQQQHKNIPIEVLNSYPDSYIDSKRTNPTQTQNYNTAQQDNGFQNNYQGGNPLMNILPLLLKGDGLDISGLIKMLNKTQKHSTRKKQKNSPKIGEYISIDDYNF